MRFLRALGRNGVTLSVGGTLPTSASPQLCASFSSSTSRRREMSALLRRELTEEEFQLYVQASTRQLTRPEEFDSVRFQAMIQFTGSDVGGGGGGGGGGQRAVLDNFGKADKTETQRLLSVLRPWRGSGWPWFSDLNSEDIMTAALSLGRVDMAAADSTERDEVRRTLVGLITRLFDSSLPVQRGKGDRGKGDRERGAADAAGGAFGSKAGERKKKRTKGRPRPSSEEWHGGGGDVPASVLCGSDTLSLMGVWSSVCGLHLTRHKGKTEAALKRLLSHLVKPAVLAQLDESELKQLEALHSTGTGFGPGENTKQQGSWAMKLGQSKNGGAAVLSNVSKKWQVPLLDRQVGIVLARKKKDASPEELLAFLEEWFNENTSGTSGATTRQASKLSPTNAVIAVKSLSTHVRRYLNGVAFRKAALEALEEDKPSASMPPGSESLPPAGLDARMLKVFLLVLRSVFAEATATVDVTTSTTSSAASSASVGTPFMITKQMRVHLAQVVGLSENEIRELTPQAAHDILATDAQNKDTEAGDTEAAGASPESALSRPFQGQDHVQGHVSTLLLGCSEMQLWCTPAMQLLSPWRPDPALMAQAELDELGLFVTRLCEALLLPPNPAAAAEEEGGGKGATDGVDLVVKLNNLADGMVAFMRLGLEAGQVYADVKGQLLTANGIIGRTPPTELLHLRQRMLAEIPGVLASAEAGDLTEAAVAVRRAELLNANLSAIGFSFQPWQQQPPLPPPPLSSPQQQCTEASINGGKQQPRQRQPTKQQQQQQQHELYVPPAAAAVVSQFRCGTLNATDDFLRVCAEAGQAVLDSASFDETVPSHLALCTPRGTKPLSARRVRSGKEDADEATAKLNRQVEAKWKQRAKREEAKPLTARRNKFFGGLSSAAAVPSAANAGPAGTVPSVCFIALRNFTQMALWLSPGVFLGACHCDVSRAAVSEIDKHLKNGSDGSGNRVFLTPDIREELDFWMNEAGGATGLGDGAVHNVGSGYDCVSGERAVSPHGRTTLGKLDLCADASYRKPASRGLPPRGSFGIFFQSPSVGQATTVYGTLTDPQMRAIQAMREFRSPVEVLEMFAQVRAAALFGSGWSGCTVQHRSDNSSVAKYISAMSCPEHPVMSGMLKTLGMLMRKHDFDSTAAHLPRKHNQIADSASKYVHETKHRKRLNDRMQQWQRNMKQQGVHCEMRIEEDHYTDESLYTQKADREALA